MWHLTLRRGGQAGWTNGLLEVKEGEGTCERADYPVDLNYSAEKQGWSQTGSARKGGSGGSTRDPEQ